MPVTVPASFALRRVLELVRLRYQLQWAQIRSNPTSIVVAAALLLVFVVLLSGVLLGGVGLGALAQPDSVRRLLGVVLGATFVNMLIVTLLFGLGTNQVFSERTLRRFPLQRPERLFLQYGLGLFEPTWLFALALFLGCAIGTSMVGMASPVLAFSAAVLLAAATYILARLLLTIVERLVATPAGSLMLVLLMQAAFMLPVLLANDGPGAGGLARLQPALLLTPPAAAAALMTGGSALAALPVLLAWIGAPLTALVLLDSRAPATRTARSGAATWNGPFDRIAALFPRTWEPLVGRALRYYLRNPAIRVGLIVSLTMMAFVVLRGGGSGTAADDALFARAVLFAPLGASTGTAAFAINVFGYDGSGLRRLLLCPVSPRLVLRTLAAVPLLVGTAFIWLIAAAWMALAPVASGPAMVAMLVAHALTGMLVFNAIALWPAVLAPRRVPYDQKFRNDASLGGQLAMMGGAIAILVVPLLVRFFVMGDSITAHWWLPLLVLPAAAVFYGLMLLGAERALLRRHERLMSVVEGRG